MARIRANNCADVTEQEVVNQGGGRERVSRRFLGANEVVLTKTCSMICNIRTIRWYFCVNRFE